MKKRTLGLSIIFMAMHYIVPNVLTESKSETMEQRFFEGDFLDEASTLLGVHAMGGGDHIVYVHIANPHVIRETEVYFRKLLDVHGMRDYEIEVLYIDPEWGP
ncbi:hypothetical protein AAGS61_15270 [Lysinibacillus sp. KU-BSD001]|uniref:hypothetical protein n=1 Tax=Lysinibacillus sp. KU-BSD001 TaxID=3141328 RepID=UPI0036E9B537